MRYTRGMDEPSAASSSRGAAHGKVLIVDDDPLVRAMTKRALARSGWATEEAGTGRDALELFRADPSAYACVLLDVGLPDLDGEEVLASMREADPGALVILCTGSDDSDEVKRLFGLGAAAFIQKPYSLDELAGIIGRLLG